jgi:hypothetical protein
MGLLGLLSALVGSNNKPNATGDKTDGLWLDTERKAEWTEVFVDRETDTTWCFSPGSCYRTGETTMFLLRTTWHKCGWYMYTVCGLVDGKAPGLMHRFGSRVETVANGTVVDENWTDISLLSPLDPEMPWLQKVCVKARNFAGLNSYETPPPYVLQTVVLSRALR